MDTFTNSDFIGRNCFITTSGYYTQMGWWPPCMYLVKSTNDLPRIKSDIQRNGETILSIQWVPKV
jgi:hypothetical protein